MNTPRRIGVLGGMGPEATVLLMSRVIARTPAADDSDHIPMMVDMNTQVPSRIKAVIEGAGEDPGPTLATMARGLQAAGAEALVMPCNTAHHYATWIRDAAEVPFLDMVELTAARIAEKVLAGANRRVGVLASPAVRITGIYDRAFAEHRIATVYPADEAAMLGAIRAIKRSGAGSSALENLQSAAAELTGRGADALLVACSEFSVVTGGIGSERPVVDSIDVLADAVVDFALGPSERVRGNRPRDAAE